MRADENHRELYDLVEIVRRIILLTRSLKVHHTDVVVVGVGWSSLRCRLRQLLLLVVAFQPLLHHIFHTPSHAETEGFRKLKSTLDQSLIEFRIIKMLHTLYNELCCIILSYLVSSFSSANLVRSSSFDMRLMCPLAKAISLYTG